MDPVIFDVMGPVKLRWYGLGYLMAFVLGYYLLRWQARRRLWVLPAEKVADFIAYAAFFGVFLGGHCTERNNACEESIQTLPGKLFDLPGTFLHCGKSCLRC
ncbi:MAG: prolipoprotein diacylglyceryl transferase family protein, partial [Akkermansiaceae bacterium]